MTEHELQNKIRVALSERGTIFRTNSGKFWQGKLAYDAKYGGMILTNLQAVEGLPEGFSDLFFVDNKGAAFIEVKTPAGRVRNTQEKFLKYMQAYGCRAGIARSVEDAVKIIEGE